MDCPCLCHKPPDAQSLDSPCGHCAHIVHGLHRGLHRSTADVTIHPGVVAVSPACTCHYSPATCTIHGGWTAVSPAIVEPDPDPETPMTTIPVPTADPESAPTETAVVTLTHTVNGVDQTITPHGAADVTRLIRKTNTPFLRPFVQKAKGGEGTGTLGLYLEAVVHAANGKPFTHMKFFVVGANVYAYGRTVGDSRANWKRRVVPSLGHALLTVQKALDKPNVKMFGHPVLVELTADDLSAIEEGGMPPARFRGQYRIEKDYGRYDFEMEIVSAPLPGSLVNLLRTTFVS